MAVIVNDMSEVNIDAALVRDGGAKLSRTEEKPVDFSNEHLLRDGPANCAVSTPLRAKPVRYEPARPALRIRRILSPV